MKLDVFYIDAFTNNIFSMVSSAKITPDEIIKNESRYFFM